MNLNKFSILTIIFGVLCIISIPFYFINKLNINYITLMLGLTQLFSGLSHVKISKDLAKKEGVNGTKLIGITISIMGIFFIVAASIKILV
ncbi:hypothetical protein [Clostridium nigeriense]|uniref:hypothetical protein n=1 Tax=Clostridium nigeriense TaxID=1805470 RepID=UPI00083654E9|nr:hypothetical protein [Clostridium nigeriense]